MSDHARREFIKLATLTGMALGGSALPASSSYSGHLNTTDEMLAEFMQVFEVWDKETGLDPSNYLMSRGVTGLDQRSKLQRLSVTDFELGNTITIRGLVLSMAEAGAIAALGKVMRETDANDGSING